VYMKPAQNWFLFIMMASISVWADALLDRNWPVIKSIQAISQLLFGQFLVVNICGDMIKQLIE